MIFMIYGEILDGKLQTRSLDQRYATDEEECEAVISCVQELELHVLQQDCHTA